MIFFKKKEKIYDCSNNEEYIAYRAIMHEKYKTIDLDSLKHIEFIKNMKYDIVKSDISSQSNLDVGIECATVAAVFGLIPPIINGLNQEGNYNFNSIMLIATYMVLAIGFIIMVVIRIIVQNQNKRKISMIQTEKQVLKELIKEKREQENVNKINQMS